MKINYIVEGQLEVPIARRIILFCNHQRGTCYQLRGFGNIKKKIKSYLPLANDITGVLVLTDFMDAKASCPSQAKINYLGTSNIHSNFIFRFAMPEVESWLMADNDNFSKFLGINANKITKNPDVLTDPKKYLADLARQSRKKNY